VQAADGEHQRVGRRAIEPVRVVHDTGQRLVVRDRRQQREDRDRHDEAVRHAVRREAEGGAQRVALDGG
jgi:hypothetical protein